MKKILLIAFVVLFGFTQIVAAESMYSPTWGFYIDLPEGYEFADGDGRDQFSFNGPEGLVFDIVVYNKRYNTLVDLVEDVNKRITNKGDADFFLYNSRQASIIKLEFTGYNGWGFAVELESSDAQRPMLLALSYGPSSKKELELFHISALDSISPTSAELRFPGPIQEYSYPRGEQKTVTIANGISAKIYENDAEASQVMIEREFSIMESYLNTPFLKEACVRYYRLIFRDSFARIKDAADEIIKKSGWSANLNDAQKRAFAQKILSYTQNFNYQRDLKGSDFLNLVTAVVENRGDCDNRAMLFAIILANVNIRSAIMVSHHYSHAVGLADIQGTGARFESYGTKWLVAETTANIDIGLIAQDQSDPQYWFAILFE